VRSALDTGRGALPVGLSTLALVLGLVTSAGGAGAQVRVADLVFTGGLSMEAYRGKNFSAVTVPVVDSTDHASAAVGQFGARGRVVFRDVVGGPYVGLTFDGGVRQFAAMGFELRDYAPREWAARVRMDYQQALRDVGRLGLQASFRGRSVEDRPPLPLFLQPGYATFRGLGTFEFLPVQGVTFDLEADLERADYHAPPLLSQLDLLDRRSGGIELGARTSGDAPWSVRFFTGFRWSRYEHQGTYVAEDPFRRDRTVNLGATWSTTGTVLATMGVEGSVNRSNSIRPEYDALSVRGELTTALPFWDLTASAFSLLTWKSYVHQTEFARLVPGEEADNASVLYLDLVRPLAANLDGVLRFGWTRAETDIGDSYYRRFGATFLMNFRPAGF